jgi:hypothetical protein
MKLLFAILLTTVPVAWDMWAGFHYKKKGSSVPHTFTSVIRGIGMTALVLLSPVMWWQAALLTVGFHWLVFPILYNTKVLGVHWSYVGETAKLDKAERWLRNKITTPGVFFFKLALLMSAVKFYVNPNIY